tara:strand:- start:1220 stop:2005 length:786 start_codon:yes stop_codon:yes gene_type:complete
MAAVTAAVVGIGTSLVSTGMSFSNAAKQKRAAAEADEAAKKAMADAKSKASKDFYEGLNVPLDAYEAEFENNLAVAQQNTEALQEGDARALAAGVGRVGAQAGANAEQTRIAMGEQISDLQETKAQSKDAVNQQLLQMDVAAAKEANQRKNAAEQARAASIQQGIQGIGSSVNAIASAAPLFGKSKGVGKSLADGGNAFGSKGLNLKSGTTSGLQLKQTTGAFGKQTPGAFGMQYQGSGTPQFGGGLGLDKSQFPTLFGGN